VQRVLARATGQMAGLKKQFRCFVIVCRACARGHQESKLTLRSEDHSVANAPKRSQKMTLFYETKNVIEYIHNLPDLEIYN
jgi:hypothetical protein